MNSYKLCLNICLSLFLLVGAIRADEFDSGIDLAFYHIRLKEAVSQDTFDSLRENWQVDEGLVLSGVGSEHDVTGIIMTCTLGYKEGWWIDNNITRQLKVLLTPSNDGQPLILAFIGYRIFEDGNRAGGLSASTYPLTGYSEGKIIVFPGLLHRGKVEESYVLAFRVRGVWSGRRAGVLP